MPRLSTAPPAPTVAQAGESLGPNRREARDRQVLSLLARKHVAVLGADASPHVTGFPHFTSALLGLLEEIAGQVSQPLRATLRGVPDLVVAVLPGPGAAGAATHLADQHGVPLLVIIEGETAPPRPDATTVGGRLAARLEGTVLRRADRWAVTGAATRSRLNRLDVPDGLIDELPYWVRPAPEPAGHPERHENAERQAARRALGWTDGFLVVCPVGVDTSGPAVALAAAAHLTRRSDNLRIVLVGSGPRFRALRSMARPVANAEVLELADRDYPTALIAADLLLISEAGDQPDPATAGRLAACLAAGRPVVAAVGGGGDQLSAELAHAQGSMVTVPPQQPQQLADVIDVLRNTPQARAVMAAAARGYTRAWLGTAAAGSALGSIMARTLSSSDDPSWWGRAR